MELSVRDNFEAAYGYLFAGSLESANSSILAPCDLFKEVVGRKNQDFMLIRSFNPSDLIGCGGGN